MTKSEKQGAIIQIVKIKTNLSRGELLHIAREREPQFRAIPGILQKYYIELGAGEYGGVYIWDSAEALQEFRQSELAATIANAYQSTEPPSIDIADVLFQLRD